MGSWVSSWGFCHRRSEQDFGTRIRTSFIRRSRFSHILKVITYYSETDQLKDPALFMSLYGRVSAERRKKIDSYIFPKDKRLSLGAGILLRKALEDLGEDPDSFSLAHAGNGKPFLLDSSIHFNLSHSEERVMCSVSDCDVGCDVEKIRQTDTDMAKSCFFGTEYKTICEETDKACRTE